MIFNNIQYGKRSTTVYIPIHEFTSIPSMYIPVYHKIDSDKIYIGEYRVKKILKDCVIMRKRI